jgi:hypothetical protein
MPPLNIAAETVLSASSSSTMVDGRNSPRRSWEDPHPGQRLPLPGPSQVAIVRDGVAAKAESHNYNYYNRQAVTRRQLRRQRTSAPKPVVKIPIKSVETSDSKSAPVVSHQIFFASPGGSPVSANTSTRALGEAITTDMDMDADVSPPELNTSSAESTSPHYFSDYSNFLGISIPTPTDMELDSPAVTVVDSENCRTSSSMADLYGWEAELDRQLECGRTMTSGLGCGIDEPFGYKRADGAKRSLLHRVLSSMGGRSDAQ